MALATIAAAPRGDDLQVAYAILRDEGRPCPRVVDAHRTDRGAIVASCSNRSRYILFTVRGFDPPVALLCSEASKVGIACSGK